MCFRVNVGSSSEEEAMHRLFSVILAAIALVYWAYFGEPARAQSRTAQQRLAVDIYKELVEINTVTETGDTARAAEAMAARLRTAGFSESDVQVFTPAPRKGNLVARLRGTGARKPILQITLARCRSEEHTSELQSHSDLVCRLLLEKKKNVRVMRLNSQTRSQ